MTNQFSELTLVEQTAIDIFKDLWKDGQFIDAFSDQGESFLGRNNRGEVVLKKFLEPKLKELNPNIPIEGLVKAVEFLLEDRSTKALETANLEIYKMLREGVIVRFENKDGEQVSDVVKFIDLENPSNNDFMLVSQMWINGDTYTRRPDLIGFVNGIPLIFIELKGAHKNLRDAYEKNIKDYKDTIAKVFWYNAFILISNGIESKMGTISSGYEHFNEWKKVEDEDEMGVVTLDTIIRGTCDPNRFLDLFENFTLFDSAKGKLIKIVARNHQYLGVKEAFEGVENREQNKGKLGVFWHTQGSGKSYSMIFFAQKVLRKLEGNFTFVVVTDRQELDEQIYKGFLNTGVLIKKKVHAESVVHLKELLQQDNRFIFTLIHKFQPEEGKKMEVINDSKDIIVMTDEAHRSQYDILAMNMRIALPNANFIGFTGTPLIKGEQEETRNVFGDYVSVYNFADSIADKATVPIFYENRVPKMENINQKLEDDLKKIQDYYDLNEEEEEKLEKEFSTAYAILTRDDRLDSISFDIVNHFINRGIDGKAMVVCLDKKTATRMYMKTKHYFEEYRKKLEKDLENPMLTVHRERLEEQMRIIDEMDMAVVVSLGNNQNELEKFREVGIDFKPFRERIQKEDLETSFKDEDSNLRIVFVCSMWLTGFDIPSLTTLYLDKPLKNHTLMQTIARVNRVYKDKVSGLIVDYIGIFGNLRRALAVYATGGDDVNGGDGPDVVQEKRELIKVLIDLIEETKTFLSTIGIDIDEIFATDNLGKIKLIEDYVNIILGNIENKKAFMNLANKCKKLFKAILPDTRAYEFQNTVSLFNVMHDRIISLTVDEYDIEDVKKEMEILLDKSLASEKFEIEDTVNLKDLSKIDFDKLKEFFDKSRKNITMESLKNSVEDKIDELMKQNKKRRSFIDKLNKILEEYNEGSKNVDETFDSLVTLVKVLNEEGNRAKIEGLTEEELAVFDLLVEGDLSPSDEKKVKKISKELLQKLKEEKLVLDWKKKQDARADVEITIEDYLADNLPLSYDDNTYYKVSKAVYWHVYEHYMDAEHSVYG